ncbi:MAG: hypothetical protein ACK40X_03210 [Armatimonadota bacterium]
MPQHTATLITVIREQDESQSCCCSVGQTPQEVDAMKRTVEECGVEVQVVNLVNPDQVDSLGEELVQGIEKLLTLYGPFALPMLAFDGELIAIGVVEPSHAVEAITEALKREVAKS